MNSWLVTALILSAIAVVAAIVYILFRRAIARASAIPTLGGFESKKPCYRCGVESFDTYMGLHYCFMCREVVMIMMRGVSHDPPFGFPGASGYLDYPKEMVEEMKEHDRG